jgi:uncharacterized protein YjbI with pentapeptide repeats
MIGVGGAVALLLTARRQRYTELTLLHTDRDATERRITELYTKAADQLGSNHAAVRLPGLYALERLAHSAVEHRQAIVDVICAYLRMPYPPSQSAVVFGRSYRSLGPTLQRRGRKLIERPPHSISASQRSWREDAEQERQVRLTAQHILLHNLRVVAQHRRRWWHRKPQDPIAAWPGMRLNLAEALLVDFSLAGCQLDYANFARAQFIGAASFDHTEFAGRVAFGNAQFAEEASFEEARFTNDASFKKSRFSGETSFRSAQFRSEADFEGAQFAGGVSFQGAEFGGGADFVNAQFALGASFRDVRFVRGSSFVRARFSGRALYVGAHFSDRALFGGTQFTAWTSFARTQFMGRTAFRDARFGRTTDFMDAQFAYMADFIGARGKLTAGAGTV